MPTAKQFAEIVEGFAGVRWRRHGRDPRIGLDCGGIVVAGLAALGIAVKDSRDYDARMPPPALLWDLCRASCDEQTWDDQGEGRIGLSTWGDGAVPRHLVVMLGGHRIAHVDAGARCVTVVPDGWLEGKLLAVFRVRGLDYGAPWSP
jgi:hypothetical protein